jgi:hypothetical protein
MKSPVSIACQCGHHFIAETSGVEPLPDTQCPKCQMPIWIVQGLADFVNVRIMNRAWAELMGKDFTLTIVLSAMAVESEFARQYIKWRKVDYGLSTDTSVTLAKEDEWEDEWREFRNIARRLDEMATLLTGKKFDGYIGDNPHLVDEIAAAYPVFKTYTSPKEFFRKELFDKRNQVLHRGKVEFQEQDGKMAFALASALFNIRAAMDKLRYSITFPNSKKQGA